MCGAVGVVLGVYLAHGLTPYLGVQFQHTGAMLSNLRIDRGCWNSLVFPEPSRTHDAYIRVEEARIVKGARVPGYEALLREHLWSPPQLRQMRRNWCKPSRRTGRMTTIFVRGTYQGRAFVLEDLCAPGVALPFADAGMFGVSVFPNYLRFQKQLTRACPQRCIH